MRLTIRGIEIPVPVVTIILVLVNLVVCAYSSVLHARPTPPEVTSEFEKLDAEMEAEIRGLGESLSDEARAEYERTGGVEAVEKKFTEMAIDIQSRYQARSVPLLGAIPYYRFLFDYGVVPGDLRTAWRELRERLRSGVDKAAWFGVTLITCQYLHADWSHFLGNTVFLLLFGLTIEIEMGSGLFLLFYTLGGIASGAAQVLFLPDATSVLIGASGSIAAIMGAYLIVAPTARISLGWILGALGFLAGRVSAAGFLFIWFAIQYAQGASALEYGQTGGVAWFAHLGGFALGITWFLSGEAAAVFRR
jgi:membrane associated rhomboid family serine protease